MVRTLLDGRKTQTRRVVKPQPFVHTCYPQPWAENNGANRWTWYYRDLVDGKHPLYDSERDCSQFVNCPYGVAGDRLWVKETFSAHGAFGPNGRKSYRADIPSGKEPHGLHWKPSIFMPRVASRITLEITAVRVERLNAITEADAIAEGIDAFEDGAGFTVKPNGPWQRNPEDAYRNLWESINGAGSWALNPWVWVITFRRITP